jgi:hypothetical protein
MVNTSSEERNIAHDTQTGSYSTSLYEMQQDFDQLQPGPINDVCNEFSRLARTLGDVANRLRSVAGQPLKDAWESKASPDAQKHLQIAQATAAALADDALHMARATDYAYRYAKWYKGHQPGVGGAALSALSHMDISRGGKLAAQHVANLLSRYNEVITTCIPSKVSAQYVQTLSVDDYKKSGGGGNVGGLGSSHLPDTGNLAGLDSLHSPSDAQLRNDPGNPPGSHHLPGVGDSPYTSGSSLAGAGDLGGVGGGIGGGAGGAGLGPDGGFGAGAVSPGGGGSGTGTGLSPGVGFGAGGGAGAAGRSGLPLGHGGHGGQEEQERERTTWLTEDEDVWGGDTDVPPAVIGG